MKPAATLPALALLAAATAGGALGACTPPASAPPLSASSAAPSAPPSTAAASDAAPPPPSAPPSATAAAPSASAPPDDTADPPAASTADADAADAGPPHPHEVFVAKILAVGPPAHIACGFMMATQNLTVKIEQVTSGALYPGQTLSIPVLTCLAGGLLIPFHNDETVAELDPAVIKPGVRVAFDIEIDPDEGRLASARGMHVVP